MTHAIASPEPCFRQVKEVKDGVFVPSRIHRTCHCTIGGGDENSPHAWRDTCDRYPHLVAEIDGASASVEKVWTAREEIEQHEFDYLTALSRHIAENEPNAYDADPYQAVDFGTLPPPQF